MLTGWRWGTAGSVHIVRSILAEADLLMAVDGFPERVFTSSILNGPPMAIPTHISFIKRVLVF
jgi:hypothetical protein